MTVFLPLWREIQHSSKAENVSFARATGMNRDDVDKYFPFLEKTMIDSNLLNKPSEIYDMNESGFQLNNKAGKVAKKGASMSTISLLLNEVKILLLFHAVM